MVEKIKNSLKKFDINVDDGDEDFILKNNIDSITFIHTILGVEEEFSILVPDEYLLMDNLNTIHKIASMVEELSQI